jgi:importin subunit beta-1
MRKEEQDNDVRLAATKALYNAIEFASTNFRNETERNYLMQVRRIRQLLQT